MRHGDSRAMPAVGIRLAYGFEPGTTAVHIESAFRRRTDCVMLNDDFADQLPPVGSEQLLWVESGVEWMPNVDQLAAQVSGAWLIDTHRGAGWRARAARAFDVAFVAQFDGVERVRARGVPCEWLPLAAPADLCGPGPDLAERQFDIAFVGQCPPGSLRAAVLDALRPRFSIAPVAGFLDPPAMMDLYRSARIVVNIPWAGDLNMRTFEACGARALLLTGPARKVEAALPVGSFSVVAGDPTSWVRAVDAALRDGDAQRRADEAYRHVVSHHTYDHRAQTVLDVLGAARRRSLSRSGRADALAAAYARWGRLDQMAVLPLSGRARWARRVEALAWRCLILANRARRRVRVARARAGGRSLPLP